MGAMNMTLQALNIRNGSWGRLVCCIGAVLTMLVLTGCIDQAQLIALRDQAQSVRTELGAEVTRLDQNTAEPGINDEIRLSSADAAAQLRARLADLDAGIAGLDRIITSEQNPELLWGTVTDSVVPLLPEPLRSPMLLLGALGLALARAAQLKRAAGSIAKGIAKASEKDDEFRSVFDRNADTFRALQTPAAKRIVDEKVRTGFMMRLPI
jgi:outer membrane murein-binding lipoprotein Lpp